ncbi:MAG: hypothetical protein ACTSVV_10720 [Promethearchaeota archaeon]
MSKNIKLKALETIEGLTLLYQDGRRSLEDAERILDDIYKYSHIANEHCGNPHKNWVKELNDMYKSLKKDYI